jgi:aspartate aminotransferase-like enzyme
MGGQDQLKGKIIRIGHMGYITKQSQVELIHALAETLNTLKPGHLTAAQIQALHKEAIEKIESSGGL